MFKELDMKNFGWIVLLYILAKINRYYGLPEWVEGLLGFVLVIIVAQVVWNGFQNWREERRMG